MFQVPFKHGIIKNAIIAFGTLFGSVKVLRHDQSGILKQTISVPITYGPKEKVLVRTRQDPELDNQIMVQLPRMAFEISNISYDPTRTGNKFQKIACHKPDGTTLGAFMPVPYNLNISLYVLTKGTEDGLDIIEQILPTFMPDYVLRLSAVPGLNMKLDVPVVLNGVSVQDDYEGDFNQTRLVTHTLDFTMKVSLFGGLGNANLITRTDTAVNDLDTTNKIVAHTSTGDPVTGNVTSDFWQ